MWTSSWKQFRIFERPWAPETLVSFDYITSEYRSAERVSLSRDSL